MYVVFNVCGFSEFSFRLCGWLLLRYRLMIFLLEKWTSDYSTQKLLFLGDSVTLDATRDCSSKKEASIGNFSRLICKWVIAKTNSHRVFLPMFHTEGKSFIEHSGFVT